MAPDEFRDDIAAAVLSLPVVSWFGLRFTELGGGRSVARLPWRPELSHAPGVFQANPIASLADFAGVSAGLTLLPPGSTAATVDYTAKFLAEARGEALVARARVLQSGATLTVAAVDVFAEAGGAETPCAAAFVTMRNFVARAAA